MYYPGEKGGLGLDRRTIHREMKEKFTSFTDFPAEAGRRKASRHTRRGKTKDRRKGRACSTKKETAFRRKDPARWGGLSGAEEQKKKKTLRHHPRHDHTPHPGKVLGGEKTLILTIPFSGKGKGKTAHLNLFRPDVQKETSTEKGVASSSY